MISPKFENLHLSEAFLSGFKVQADYKFVDWLWSFSNNELIQMHQPSQLLLLLSALTQVTHMTPKPAFI